MIHPHKTLLVRLSLFAVLAFASLRAQSIATPTISPARGSFATYQQVLVTCSTAGVDLHYSLNGNPPTAFDPIVPASGLLSIAQSSTLKVVALAGEDSSGTASGAFEITGQLAPGPLGGFLILLKPDGTVWASGDNTSGQLGDGSLISRRTLAQISGLSEIVAVAAGLDYALALKKDGSVFSWGGNGYGQLGDGSTTTSEAPEQISGLSTIMSIACGYGHSVAVDSAGGVFVWGDNSSGQLGLGTSGGTHYSPQQVSGFVNASTAAAGGQRTTILKTDGTVWSWGRYSLGNGTAATTGSTSPVQATGLTDVVAVSSSATHSLALKANGTVYAWGGNGSGQLGFGFPAHSTTPSQVPGLASVVSVSATCGSALVGLPGRSMVRLSDGTLKAWGKNSFGTIGDGTETQRTSPVTVQSISGAVAIASSASLSLAIENDGTLWWWGDNSLPHLESAERAYDLTKVTAISAGQWHVLALRQDGTVWAWGANNYGQLGDGTFGVSALPHKVPNLENVVAISAASNYCLALKNDGTVWGWGSGSSSPAQVPGCTNVVEVSAANVHCLALRSDGTAYAWGANAYGQLGNGTLASNAFPEIVPDLYDVVHVVAAENRSFAVKGDGTTWAWGINDWGQLGDGTTDNQASPVLVTALSSSIYDLAGAGSQTLAILQNGDIWRFGINFWTDGTELFPYSDINSLELFANVTTHITSIKGADLAVLALRDNGTVGAWGGTGAVDYTWGPDSFTLYSNAVAITLGSTNKYALKSDGTVWGLGENWSGQLGNGELPLSTTPLQKPYTAFELQPELSAIPITNFTVSTNGSSQAFLNWSVPSGSTQAATVQQSIDGGVTWTTLGSVDGSLTHFTVSELDSAISYRFRVIAGNSAGSTVGGGSSSVTPVQLDPPSGLQVNVAAGVVTFTWTPPAANVGTGYKVQRLDGSTNTWLTIATSASATAQWTVPTGADVESMVFRVETNDSQGAASVPCAPVDGNNEKDTVVNSDTDSLTDAEEAEAGTDPENADTDDDQVPDDLDGWARQRNFSPRRLSKPSYAVVDLGPGEPVFINKDAQVIIRRGEYPDFTWHVWNRGEIKDITPPGSKPFNILAFSDAGIALGGYNATASELGGYYIYDVNATTIAGQKLQGSPKLYDVSPSTMSDLFGAYAPPYPVTETPDPELFPNDAHFHWANISNEFVINSMDNAGNIYGRSQDAIIMDYIYHYYDGVPTSVFGLDYHWSAGALTTLVWPNSATAPSTFGTYKGSGYTYKLPEDEYAMHYAEVEALNFFDVTGVSDHGVTIGTLTSGATQTHFTETSGSMEQKFGVRSSTFQELPNSESSYRIAPDNTIISYVAGKMKFRIDNSRGTALDKTPSSSPAYTSVMFDSSNSIYAIPNTRMQAVSGTKFWQNGINIDLTSLILSDEEDQQPMARHRTMAFDTSNLAAALISSGGVIAASTQGVTQLAHLLFPMERAPDVLRVNSNFDERKVDPVTGYAIPDCEDEDLIVASGVSGGHITTKDLHNGFFGLNPSALPPEFFAGTTVTIRKLAEIDEETSHVESGEIRMYVTYGRGTAAEQSWPIQLEEAPPVSPDGDRNPRNLVQDLYSTTPTYPRGVNVEYWMEGMQPGPITLEFKWTGGSSEISMKQKFMVCTRQSKKEWQKEIRDEILLQTTDAVDMSQYNHQAQSFLDAKTYIQATYAYYGQLHAENPKLFLWAGFANMAGGPVYAAMVDAQYAQYGGVFAFPFGAGAARVANFVQHALMKGNNDIFDDMAWQFRAYQASGIYALRYSATPGNSAPGRSIDLPYWEGMWEGECSEDPTLIALANLNLTDREQRFAVQPTWNLFASFQFTGVQYFLSVLAKSPIPGGADLNEVVGPLADVTDIDDRWLWITSPGNGMWHDWAEIAQAGRLMFSSEPLRDRAETYSKVYIYSNGVLPIIW